MKTHDLINSVYSLNLRPTRKQIGRIRLLIVMLVITAIITSSFVATSNARTTYRHKTIPTPAPTATATPAPTPITTPTPTIKPTTTPIPTSTPSTGTNLTPPDGKCYNAAYIQSSGTDGSTKSIETTINKYETLTGKNLFMKDLADETNNWGEDLWQNIGDQYWGANYATIIQTGTINALQINLWFMLKDQYSDTTTVKQIGQGQWDSYIHKIASEAKAFSYPIFLRLAPEMNIHQGTQYWGGTSYASNPQDIISAWQRVVNIFRSDGVTNVQFVWSPNCADSGPHHWTEYYPGNSYVDWVGIDTYQYAQNTDPNTYMGIYNDYHTQKPIVIAEWGVNWVGQNFPDSSRASFINKFFDAVEARPDIKMVCYHFGGDFVFNAANNPLTTAAFQNRISNSRYIATTS